MQANQFSKSAFMVNTESDIYMGLKWAQVSAQNQF